MKVIKSSQAVSRVSVELKTNVLETNCVCLVKDTELVYETLFFTRYKRC